MSEAVDDFRTVLRALIESYKSPEPYVTYELDCQVHDLDRTWAFARDVCLLEETYSRLDNPALLAVEPS